MQRWLPALALMTVIFISSSIPSSDMPSFNALDSAVKKGGHMVGYALLALSFWYALGGLPAKRPLAWLLALAYALTDEFHQSFVPGRGPSLWDVFLFDAGGAALALWLWPYFRRFFHAGH